MGTAVTCGQLLLCGFDGPRPGPALATAIARGERGGLIIFKRNMGPFDALAAMLAEVAASAPEPLLTSVDQEGGRVARLFGSMLTMPPALQLSALDVESIERAAALQSAELRALGFTMNFAPVLDVHSRPENPVIGDRSFGTKSEDAIRGALAFWRGMKRGGILGCGKHFPGHGDTRTDSHLELPIVDGDRARLDAVELAPFRAAVREGIPALMSAHVVYPALVPGDRAPEPATLSRAIATDLLRGTLGFDGVLVSDDLEMRAIADRHGAGDSAVMAIEAGCDLLLVCKEEAAQDAAFEALVARAERDPKFRARCEEANARAMRMKKTCLVRADYAAFVSLAASEEARAVTAKLEALRA
jgi:beta-N-acetylhexosaminidase